MLGLPQDAVAESDSKDPEKEREAVMKRYIWAAIAAVATLIVSFVLTNFVYIKLADWQNQDPGAMAAMGGVVLGLVIAPVCASIAGGLVFWWLKMDSIPK